MSKYQFSLLSIFIIFWIWAAVEPLHPSDWLLENYLVFFFVPVIVILGRWFKLSNTSYTLITLFLIMHVIGSHYTYAEVPFGDSLQDWLGASRNMYDRLVHFSYGLLLAYPMREIFTRVGRARGFWSYFWPVDITLSFSAIYEIIEWLTAINVDPAAGIAFLGSQGDIWDAQKDMALAGLGALIAMLIIAIINWKYNPHFWSEIKESLKINGSDKPFGEVRLRELVMSKKSAKRSK